MHTAKVGSEGYEIDYVSMGKRSDKVFIRIYLKSKEVIEKNYNHGSSRYGCSMV